VLLAVMFAGAGTAGRAEEIWIEGESPRSSAVTEHSWYSSVKKGLLSGGKWLSHFGERDGTADYDVEVKTGGRYTLWLRANPIQAALAYRWNGKDWVEVDFEKRIDNLNIAADDRPDLRYVAWVNAGAVSPEGKNTPLQDAPANHHHGAIDCFLSPRRRSPRGSRGRAKSSASRKETRGRSRRTLMHSTRRRSLDPWLNEKTAGGSGAVRSRQWRFARERETGPLGGEHDRPRARIRGLASTPIPCAGVNMVRFHGAIWPRAACPAHGRGRRRSTVASGASPP
jgi:hypothetical protein